MFKELDRESFTDEDLYRFIAEKHSIANNPLIKEILSDPSGQAPKELIDEDSELEQLFSQEVANVSDNVEGSNDLYLLSAT
jgi:hypothetical protein